MNNADQLLANNRTWAKAVSVRDPTFFPNLARQQAPRYLWIGCSDSRVPANEIVGLLPGEIFVHRNVANVVVHTDLNCLAVIQYAVDVLRIEQIIVCGHYGCGGVEAAWNGTPLGLIDNWLRHVQDVAERHQLAHAPAMTQRQRVERLCELNVLEQVRHVCRTTIVQDAWKRRQPVMVHGWIYRLEDGLIRDLGLSVESQTEVETRYRAAVDAGPHE